MSYLLDTDILSSLLRTPVGIVEKKIALVGLGNVRTSIIVASELRFGAYKRSSTKLEKQTEGLLQRLSIVPFESPADEYYGRLRSDLERRGKPIGANDMLIAAQALALGDTLVTNNVREFSRINALKVENWLA